MAPANGGGGEETTKAAAAAESASAAAAAAQALSFESVPVETLAMLKDRILVREPAGRPAYRRAPRAACWLCVSIFSG